jgi:hypothetical protein
LYPSEDGPTSQSREQVLLAESRTSQKDGNVTHQASRPSTVTARQTYEAVSSGFYMTNTLSVPIKESAPTDKDI